MLVTFRPSICHQTVTEHTHYNLILIYPLPDTPNNTIEQLQRIARRVGGRTAGDIILGIQQYIKDGGVLSKINIVSMRVEHLPLWQICHKGENDSPSIDWDQVVYYVANVGIPFQFIH